MAVGKIWGSNYTQKKIFYQPGTYAKKLNRAASEQFFNTQKAAISNLLSVSSTTGYNSLELTIRNIGKQAAADFQKSQATTAELRSSLDISV